MKWMTPCWNANSKYHFKTSKNKWTSILKEHDFQSCKTHTILWFYPKLFLLWFKIIFLFESVLFINQTDEPENENVIIDNKEKNIFFHTG